MTSGPETKGPGTVTQLLHQASHGNQDAFNKLLPLVYEELKQLARKKLRAEREGHTLNATALVHEADLKLVDQKDVEWQSRTHFFAIASQAMRRILIDYAKLKKAGKRGGGAPHVSLETAESISPKEIFTDDHTNELIASRRCLESARPVRPTRCASCAVPLFRGSFS